MFYFFEREREFVCVEFSGSNETGYHLAIAEPGGQGRIETFGSAEAAYDRWTELQEQFQRSGWCGPSERD